MTIVSGRRGWFDRFVLAPIARLGLPFLVDRGATGGTVGAVGLALGIAGLVTIGFGLASIGLLLALAGCSALPAAKKTPDCDTYTNCTACASHKTWTGSNCRWVRHYLLFAF